MKCWIVPIVSHAEGINIRLDLHKSGAVIHRLSALFVILAALAVMAAVWSTLLIIKPKQETLDQRVQDVASQLRCPVCQGESVADSQATIAHQMRQVIRETLQSGNPHHAVVQYFVPSYVAPLA